MILKFVSKMNYIDSETTLSSMKFDYILNEDEKTIRVIMPGRDGTFDISHFFTAAKNYIRDKIRNEETLQEEETLKGVIIGRLIQNNALEDYIEEEIEI